MLINRLLFSLAEWRKRFSLGRRMPDNLGGKGNMKKAWQGESSSVRWGWTSDACLPLRLTDSPFLPKAGQNLKNLFISIPPQERDLAGARAGVSRCMSAARAGSRVCNGEMSDVSLRSWSHVCWANYRSLRLFWSPATLPDPAAEIPFLRLLPSPPKNGKQQNARPGLFNECDLVLLKQRSRRFRGCQLDAAFVDDSEVPIFRGV